MSKLDLNIQNYDVEDIMNLFHIESYPITYEDLKNAKKIALKTHPDKCNLDKSVYLFFVKALETLVYIYEFNRTSQSATLRENFDEACDPNIAKFALMSSTNKRDFLKKFNELFDETYIKSQEEEDGYQEELKSNKNFSKAIIKYEEPEETYTSKTYNNITGERPTNYDSELNEQLQYGDLRNVLSSGLTLTKENAYIEVGQQFKNVQELERFRSKQNLDPCIDGEERLKERENQQAYISSSRAYKLAKQNELIENKQQRALKYLKQLGNY
tara:strand:+ start:7550 stop:8362 length:813 start_codon:yes stop_codon:yes gene_type:complete